MWALVAIISAYYLSTLFIYHSIVYTLYRATSHSSVLNVYTHDFV